MNDEQHVNEVEQQGEQAADEGLPAIDATDLSLATDFVRKQLLMFKGAHALEHVIEQAKAVQAFQGRLAGEKRSVELQIAELKRLAADELSKHQRELQAVQAQVVKGKETAVKFGEQVVEARREVEGLRQEKKELLEAVAKLEETKASIQVELKSRFGL